MNKKLCSLNYITNDGFHLGAWVSAQRGLYKKNRLSEEKIKLLEKISFWEWDKRNSDWKTAYNHLIKYLEKNNKLCPRSYINADGFKLGVWVDTQKSNSKKKKLSDHRIKLLKYLEDNYNISIL